VSSKHQSSILISPLDWGLGHATRCIPIIKHLLHNDQIVYVASDGASLRLLQIHFPTVRFFILKGYNIQYTQSKRWLMLRLLLQVPKILLTIYTEHQWLKKIVQQHSIDIVIADNRFGLWNRNAKCIFITHQLNVKGPHKWIETLFRKVNYHHINKFSQCWVPDFEGSQNLAGQLSHPNKLPAIPVRYIGALSRFEGVNASLPFYQLCIVISGPEPQRSLFEAILLTALKTYQHKVVFVRGLPLATINLPQFNKVTIFNHLPAHQLQQVMADSELIISRSGYTTVMDVVKLKKRSVMVPTPGQTEQEYIADNLQQHSIAITFPQMGFDLAFAIKKAKDFKYQFPSFDMELYKKEINCLTGKW